MLLRKIKELLWPWVELKWIKIKRRPGSLFLWRFCSLIWREQNRTFEGNEVPDLRIEVFCLFYRVGEGRAILEPIFRLH